MNAFNEHVHLSGRIKKKLLVENTLKLLFKSI